MAYDPNIDGAFYNFGSDPFFSNNVFRYSTGGASPSLRFAASQLTNGNAGTTYANMASQSAQRQAAQTYRDYVNRAQGGGAGGNYNLLSGAATKLFGNANDELMRAYGEGARINQQGVAEGGNLTAKADQLDQSGKEASLNYLARLRPEEFSGYSQYLQNQYQDSEGFWQGLGKGLLTGGLGAGLGALTGGLGYRLSGWNPKQ